MAEEESCVAEDEIFRWKEAIEGSKVLLFAVSGTSRSLTTMILAAHYIGAGRTVVLCVEQLPEDGCQLGSEKVNPYYLFTSLAAKKKCKAQPKLISNLS